MVKILYIMEGCSAYYGRCLEAIGPCLRKRKKDKGIADTTSQYNDNAFVGI